MKKLILLVLILVISVSVFAQEDWTENTREKTQERVEKKFNELCPVEVEENRVCCIPDVSGLLNEEDPYAHFKYDHCYPNYVPSDCSEEGIGARPASCEGVSACQKICCAIPTEKEASLSSRPSYVKSDFSYEKVIQNHCSLVKGHQVQNEYCEPSCCQKINSESKPSYERESSGGECAQGGGTVVDKSFCDTVCCRHTYVSTEFGYYSEIKTQEKYKGSCISESGMILEASMCKEKLCCEYYDEQGRKQVKSLPKGTCDAYQGSMKGEPEEQEFLMKNDCNLHLFEDVCCKYKTEEGEGRKWMNGAECEKLSMIEGVYSVDYSPYRDECEGWEKSQTYEGGLSFPQESSEIQTPPANAPEEQIQQPTQIYSPSQTSNTGKCTFNPDYIYPKMNYPIELPESPRINQDRINEGSKDSYLNVGESTSYKYNEETKCFSCIRYVTNEGRESYHTIEVDCSEIDNRENPKVVSRKSKTQTLYDYFKGFFERLLE